MSVAWFKFYFENCSVIMVNVLEKCLLSVKVCFELCWLDAPMIWMVLTGYSNAVLLLMKGQIFYVSFNFIYNKIFEGICLLMRFPFYFCCFFSFKCISNFLRMKLESISCRFIRWIDVKLHGLRVISKKKIFSPLIHGWKYFQFNPL